MYVSNGCGDEGERRRLSSPDFELSSTEIEVLKAEWRKLSIGAAKADVLRYMLLYEFGGIYFDVDTACNRPLREWVHPEASFVTGQGGRGDIMQWGLIASAAHPIFAQTLRLVIQHIQEKNPHHVEDDVEGVAGPPILWEGARSVFCQPKLGGVTDRLQTYVNDEFGGRTQFKASGVDEERAGQGHSHWSHQQDQYQKLNEEQEAKEQREAEAAGDLEWAE